MKLREILQTLEVDCELEDGATTWDADNLLSDPDVIDDDDEYITTPQGIHKINPESSGIIYPPVFRFAN